MNLLKQLTKLRKNLLRLSCHALSEHATLPKPPCIHQPGSSLNTSCWVFMEASLHRRDWVNDWPLVVALKSPAPLRNLLEGSGRGMGGWVGHWWEWVGLKVPTLWSSGWFPGNQPPSLGAIQKSLSKHKTRVFERCLLWISRHLYHSYNLGNSKDFSSSVPEMGQRPNKYFLLQIIVSQSTPRSSNMIHNNKTGIGVKR